MTPNDPATQIRQIVAGIEPALIAIRRDIHAHPELGFEEIRTSGVVAAKLERLGIPHERCIGFGVQALSRAALELLG